MKILVDADACKVVNKAVKIAKKNGIRLVLFSDTNHDIRTDYGEVRIVSSGSDAVDFAILNNCEKGDIVVTNDGGLATLVLAKKGFVLNSYGKSYTDQNIDEYLNARYIRERIKRSGRKSYKGLPKGNMEGHADFYTTLLSLISQSKLAISA